MRFVQGIDYGPRKGTLGLAVHMAEGGDGTLGYLARRGRESNEAWRTRVRGVSCNFLILSTGEVVQMVGWAKASGSMNPRDRGDTSGFYQTKYIRDVLGSHYVDPNAYSLSVEISGFRAQGPNQRQVDSLVELAEESLRRFPTMRGAYGHADQTDTKGCPGTAPLMLEAWRRIGHGLFTLDGAMKLTDPTPAAGTVTFNEAWRLWRVRDDVETPPVPIGTTYPTTTLVRYHHGTEKPEGYPGYLVPRGDDHELYVAPATKVTFTPTPSSPPASQEYPVTVTIGGKQVTDTVTLP